MTLKEEVAAVANELRHYHVKCNANDGREPRSLAERVAFWAIVTTALAATTFSIAGAVLAEGHWLLQSQNRQAFLVCYLLLTIFTAVLLVLDFQRSKVSRFLKDPTGEVLCAMPKRLMSQVEFFTKLDEFSSVSIRYVGDELARRSKLGHSTTGLLVGSLTRVGLFPAVLLILIAISKTSTSKGVSVYEVSAFFMVALYFFCFRLGEFITKFEQYGDVLETYLNGRKSTEEQS